MKLLKNVLMVCCAFILTGAFTLSHGAVFPPAPAPAGTDLGYVKVNPYGNSPLTALIDLNGEKIYDVKVKVMGKPNGGVSIEYPVGPQSINTHDGIPVFGLYPNYKNKVTVTFKNRKDNKAYTNDYNILTGGIENKYMDNRDLSVLPEIKIHKVVKGFEGKLFMTNTHNTLTEGSNLVWAARANLAPGKSLSLTDAPLTTGSMSFESSPLLFITDTQGEYRWWFDQDAVYNTFGLDVLKKGYLMGIRETQNGTFTFVQGQMWGEFDLTGKILIQHRLPRGYVDASHESVETSKGTILIRAAKANYKRPDGQVVHTIRDHILEVDRSGRLIDVWDLNTILDPMRDVLLKGLDMGAVCVNVDISHAGQTAIIEPDADFGDIAGVGAGRNWAHVNSIQHDKSDDSIILSFRHQGVVKVTRDKKVKWILAPKAGWNKELSKKVLQPVDSKGKKLQCSDNGECGEAFDFVFTQHTAWLSPKGTLTVFDNGDGRHNTQPALPTDKYSRFVEYKIDEKNMTVQQIWEYGKERGYDWYSPITSNVEYITEQGGYMYGFGGSIGLFEPGKATIGKHNIIKYGDKSILVEIDVLSSKPNSTHYRGVLVEPARIFSK